MPQKTAAIMNKHYGRTVSAVNVGYPERLDKSPDAYREKWGLDPSYPMVAPNYAAARSQLAKKMGLGRKRK